MTGSMQELIVEARPQVPHEVLAALSMLSYEERALLFALARDSHGEGAIIDAGCFVGGSTVALAAGLHAGRNGPPGVIHSYDLLRSDPEHTAGYSAEIDALPPASDLRPLFEQQVRSWRDLVTLHQGDLLQQRWSAHDRVEILFIDVCKSWELNAHATRQFFPALIPGRSVVIQQDLVHWRYPWCAIVMETLQHRFQYWDWTWYASSVWRCVELPTQREISIDWRHDIDLRSGLDLLTAAAHRHGGWGIPLLELCRATLMHEHGDDERALAEVDRVEWKYGNSVPYIDNAYATVRSLAGASG